MTLDDTFSSRDQVNHELLTLLRPDAERWGVTITRVEIFNISPPQDIKVAMENQIKAERERRSNVLTADGNRQAAIVQSRGNAAKVVITADGQRAADLINAKGDARGKLIAAEAESKSLIMLQDACSTMGVRGVDYLIALQYLESVAMMGTDKEVIMVPTDCVNGLADIVAFNKKVL